MNVGVKIANLRKNKKLSQPELAHRLGISQTALCDIESGKTKKIDFVLMDKVCKELEVDSDYFRVDKQVNNITKLDGSINNHGTINLFPENIIEQITLLVEDNKRKELKIKELEALLNKDE